ALPAQPRLLLAEDVFGLLAPEVRQAHEPMLAAVQRALGRAAGVRAAGPDFEPLYWAMRYVQGWEAWQTDGPLIQRHALALGPGVKERFAWSSTVTRQQYEEHGRVREAYRQSLAALLGADGVLVLPTMPDVAPLLDDGEDQLDDYR